MKIEEAKEFMLWLKSNGVQQCAFDGLSVMFSPRAVRAGDAFVVNDRVDIQDAPQRPIEELF